MLQEFANFQIIPQSHGHNEKETNYEVNVDFCFVLYQGHDSNEVVSWDSDELILDGEYYGGSESFDIPPVGLTAMMG